MITQTFAKKLEAHGDKKLLDSKDSNTTPSQGGTPPSLHRYLGNQGMNQLMEATKDKESQRQDHLDNQGTRPESNLNKLMPVFRKQYGVSESNDPVEKEATSVASQIVNMEEPSTDSNAQIGISNEMGVWRSPIITRKQEPSQDIYSAVDLDLPTSDGLPLERSVTAYMEPQFGYSFQDVRIHTSAQSADLSRDLSARAFTVGKDIYFGHGEYNPQTNEGKKLIAHELTHVVQQGQASQINNTTISRTKKEEPKKTVSLHINHLEKGPTSHASELSKAQETFAVANVDIKEVKSEPFDDAKTKSLIGDDYILDEYTSVGTATAEEAKLTAEPKGRTTGAISMYLVKGMSRGSTGESFWPKDWPTVNPSVVITSKDTKETFSHELGHVLLNDGGHHGDKDNLMFTTNFKFNLDETQRKTIYNSSFAK